MPQIDVPGVGVLNFPDGMSDVDMEKAIQAHPSYTKAAEPKETKEEGYKKAYRREGATKWDKFDAAANLGLAKIRGYLPEVPGHETMEKNISPSLVKGIPIAKQFVPQTSELTEFENKHPKLATGLNVAGAVGSTLPAAGAAASRSDAGYLNQFMGQTAVAAPLNAADLIAKKGTSATAKEGAKALGMGALTSTLPAAITGTIGQAPRIGRAWEHIPEYLQSMTGPGRWPMSNFRGMTGNFFGRGPTPPPPGSAPPWALTTAGATQTGPNIFAGGAPRIPDPTFPMQSGRAISGSAMEGVGQNLTTVLGGLGGAYGAADPILGALLGISAGRHAIHPMIQTLLNTAPGRAANAVSHHPSTQDILRALAAQTGQQPAPQAP